MLKENIWYNKLKKMIPIDYNRSDEKENQEEPKQID